MYLKKIEINNFRLWKKANIDLEKQSTVIVGKNNTGKTSLMDLIQLLVNNKNISFDDYPLGDRKILYENILNYLNGKESYEKLVKGFLLPKITMYVDYSYVFCQLRQIVLGSPALSLTTVKSFSSQF